MPTPILADYGNFCNDIGYAPQDRFNLFNIFRIECTPELCTRHKFESWLLHHQNLHKLCHHTKTYLLAIKTFYFITITLIT